MKDMVVRVPQGAFSMQPRRCPDCCKEVDFDENRVPAPHDCSFPIGFWATLVQILTGR
jgi:hypothetical protein